MIDLKEIFAECVKRGIQQKEKEFTQLMKLIVNNKYKSVLEIGAYSNGCTYAFSQICESVVSIDLEHKSHEKIKNVFYIWGDSHSPTIISKLNLPNPDKFDVIFIDGDHTYAGVRQDYENYKDLCNAGGIICFHDIWDTPEHSRLNCFVSKLWNELKQENDFIEFGGDIQTWGGIGILLK